MLKALVILVAIVFAVVNVSAQGSSSRRRVVRKVGVVRVGPSTTYLKQGLSTEEVVRLLGEPTASFRAGRRKRRPDVCVYTKRRPRTRCGVCQRRFS